MCHVIQQQRNKKTGFSETSDCTQKAGSSTKPLWDITVRIIQPTGSVYLWQFHGPYTSAHITSVPLMFWRLVTLLLGVTVCCISLILSYFSTCPLKTLLNTAKSTTLLTNIHTTVHSLSDSLLTVTSSYNRPTPLAWPNHHQSGSHCIFVPGRHMTPSLLLHSKHRQSLDRCVDFLKAVTSHIWYLSRRPFVKNVGSRATVHAMSQHFLAIYFSFRIVWTDENIRVLFFFKMCHDLSNVPWSQSCAMFTNVLYYQLCTVVSEMCTDLSNVPWSQ